MATDNHSTDRLSGDSGPAASVTDWHTALTDYQAKAEVVEAGDLDEAGFDRLVDAMYEAWDEVIAAPAPSLAEVVVKVEMIRTRYSEGGFATTDEDTGAIIADLRRLNADRLRPVAEAWIDRWTALGGTFGAHYGPNGEEKGIGRGIPEPDFWTPPTTQNPALAPHQWITDEADHRGAVKVLDAFLTLVPGLGDVVRAIAEERGLIHRLSKEG